VTWELEENIIATVSTCCGDIELQGSFNGSLKYYLLWVAVELEVIVTGASSWERDGVDLAATRAVECEARSAVQGDVRSLVSE